MHLHRIKASTAFMLVGVVIGITACIDDEASKAPVITDPVRSVTTPVASATCSLATLQAAVASLAGDLQTTISAVTVSAEGATATGGAVSATNPALPAHCVVTAVIAAHLGAPGATQYGNNIRVRLPNRWNGKFFFQGGGGNNGSVGNAVGTLRDNSNALQRGYAVLAQDSGHAGSSPTFALDSKAYLDFANASLHDATLVAKSIIGRYYGRAPDFSYFDGCSNGGREAMVTAQRFDDFNGVIAGAPAMNIFDQWTQDIWNLRIFSELSGTAPGAVPTNTSGAFTDAQLNTVNAYFMQKCDALDGATDGLIAKFRSCPVTTADITALRCAAQGGSSTDANCLGAAQAAGIRKFYDGPVNSAGTQIFPGFYPGVEINIRANMLGTVASPLGSFYASIMPNMYYMGYGFRAYPGVTGPADVPASYPNAVAYVAGFNFDTEPAKFEPGRLLFHGDNLDPARPGPSFQQFRARNGRMILYSGTADASVQAPGVTAFMDKAIARFGAASTDNSMRLFMVPGMGHCGGGRATERFDELTPLELWVERGIAPEAILASAVPGGALDPLSTGVTRPLCPYPKFARYTGGGSTASSLNHACVAE